MVLEALAAVGLAGNLVQFVHFTSGLMSKSRQIHQSALGLPDEVIDLGVIATHLHEYTKVFGNASVGQEKIASVASRCQDVAFKLLKVIKELEPKQKSGRKTEKWGSFRQALKSVLRREEVMELQSRLESLRDELVLHLVSRNCGQQSDALAALHRLETDNRQSGFALTSRISDMSLKINDIKNDLPRLGCAEGLSDLQKYFDKFTSQLEILTRDHTATRNKMILESLRFPSMSLRYSNISEAHSRTFDWIFDAHRLPKTDPRSTIKLSSWLVDGQGIYWISGKPGSGKSTLMKYLEESDRVRQALLRWANGIPLSIASFYFWNSGTEMQKSLLGLLQSLLYTIMSGCPQLISALCPRRTSCGDDSLAASDPWTIAELRQAFAILKEQKAVPMKFCLHVDGLDEYDGDHFEVIDILQFISMAPSVKLLLSSRPWNCFEHAFGSSEDNKLYLHHLTKNDIELCTRERLQTYMGNMYIQDQHMCKNLVTEIVERAQGVFLWVYLVINSLRNGFINGDSAAILQERLRALPTDLEKFFQQILDSVEPVYREALASTLLVALDSPEPLQIRDYSFLEEHPDYAFQLDYQPLNRAAMRLRVAQMHTRLKGRYKGLLEVSRHRGDVKPEDTVDFLHRTLRDYLRTPRVKQQLQQDTSSDFNSFVLIGRAFLAAAKLGSGHGPESFERPVAWAREITRRAKRCEEEYAIYDSVERVLRVHWMGFRRDPGQIMLKNAVLLGHVGYVTHRLQAQDEPAEDKDGLLREALLSPRLTGSRMKELLFRESYHHEKSPIQSSYYPDLVKPLLEAGANPNAMAGTTSTWRRFLGSFDYADVAKEDFHSVFGLLLRYGVSVNTDYDLWVGYLCNQSLRTLFKEKDSVLHGTIRLLQTMLENRLNPNMMHHGATIWSAYLALDGSILPLRDFAPVRKQLLSCFLLHGAKLDQMFQGINTGKSWFEETLSHIQASVRADEFDQTLFFDVFLKFGLDPNTRLNHQSIWERVIDAMRTRFDTIQEYLDFWSTNYLSKISHWATTLIVVFLQYGADPLCHKLDSVLQMTFWGRSVFGEQGIAEIHAALRKETERVTSGRTTLPTHSRQPNRVRRVGRRREAQRNDASTRPLKRAYDQHSTGTPGFSFHTDANSLRPSTPYRSIRPLDHDGPNSSLRFPHVPKRPRLQGN